MSRHQTTFSVELVGAAKLVDQPEVPTGGEGSAWTPTADTIYICGERQELF
jgi:hypothetical protein